MSKTKMRCTKCNKWFQSANAKDVTCPECLQKLRKEKLAAKNAPPVTAKPAAVIAENEASMAPKPKPAKGGTSQWFDALEDIKVAEPEPPPVRPKIPSPPPRREEIGQSRMQYAPAASEEKREEQPNRPPRQFAPGGLRPRQPMRGAPKPTRSFGGKPSGKRFMPKGRPVGPPKPKRAKTPPPSPFTPTPEQIQLVEERYLQLAQPEFDGIRTQIARELGIPKPAVKKIVKELRARANIPSWWDLSTYAGTAEQLEKIKAIYDPYLPVPFVGVHKKIAEELSLKEGVVYQAIKKIREDMGLPQYNDPAFHAEELAQIAKERQAAKERREAEKQARLAAKSEQSSGATVAVSAEVVAAVSL